MTLPYILRLLCLCLGCFFAVHLGVGLVVGICARPVLPVVLRRRPRDAARLLLTLRLLPACAAAVSVALLCAPSYIWFEPRTGEGEEIGLAFLAAALGGGALWVVSLARVSAAGIRSLRYLRRCRLSANRDLFAGMRVWLVPDGAAQVVLAGVLRPNLVVSRHIAETLPSEQLDVALLHERAHWTARDNLKRLVLLLAPGFFPFSRPLERAWAHVAEWAADDRAVGGNRDRALLLAETLVAVARIGATAQPHRLATSLLSDSQSLAARVDRLLAPVSLADEPCSTGAFWTAGAALLSISPVLLIAQPGTLATVHSLLEQLAH